MQNQYQPLYDEQSGHQPSAPPLQPAQDAPFLDKQARFQYAQSQYRDWIWAILFLAHLVGMFIVAGVYAGRSAPDQSTGVPTEVPMYPFDKSKALQMCVGAAFIGVIFAAVWLGIMKACAAQIIKLSIILCCALMVVLGGYFAARGVPIGGVFFIIIALVLVLFYYCVRKRIPFASACIEASVQSIQDNSGPVFVAYGVAALQILWLVFWAFTAGSVFSYYDEIGTGGGGGTYFMLLVSLYWTGQVLMNVSHVTTAGTVGSWWLQPGVTSPTSGALRRALTTSFGSICLGSLIVAVLQAMRTIVREARAQARQSNNCGAQFVLCCVDLIVSMLERFMVYFNMYAYTQVAIYGKDYISSAKDTWNLFVSRGFEAVINDDLTGLVTTLGCFMGGSASGLIIGFWAYSTEEMRPIWVVPAIVAFLIGFIMTALVMNVVESAVATTFVCWAEDPLALSEGRPEHFNKLRAAAQELYPDFSG